MITKITDSNDLNSGIPNKTLQHNYNDGIILDDMVMNANATTPPNSRTIFDTQTQYIKVEYNRAITIFSGSPDVDLNTLANDDEFVEWKNSRVFVLNNKVLVHQYDMHPDQSGATVIQRDGYYIEQYDIMYLYINQNTGYNTVTFYY